MSDGPKIPNKYCVEWLGYPASPYSYRPSLAAGVVFCTIFFLSATLHTAQAIKARRWWQLTFTIGAVAELIGWAGRTWSSQCPYQSTPFLIQISTLIFAPAFFTAGTYIILGRLIKLFGHGVSPLGPNTYLYVFFSIDTVSLIIQAVGGGIAASGLDKPGSDTTNGTNAMIAGIVFQLASVLVFSALMAWVIYQTNKKQIPALTDTKVRWVIAATGFSVLCVVIRSIYRTIEMLQGWRGYLMTNERFFIALDGALMVACVVVFNIASPGWSEGAVTWGGRAEEGRKMAGRKLDKEVVAESGPEMVEQDSDRA